MGRGLSYGGAGGFEFIHIGAGGMFPSEKEERGRIERWDRKRFAVRRSLRVETVYRGKGETSPSLAFFGSFFNSIIKHFKYFITLRYFI